MKLLLIALSILVLGGCSPQNQESKSPFETKIEAAAIFTDTSTDLGDYGTVSASTTKIFKFKNEGDTAGPATPTLSDADFSIILQSGCGTVNVGSTCTVRVNFNPTGKADGIYEATLTVGGTTKSLSATKGTTTTGGTTSGGSSTIEASISGTPVVSPLDYGTLTGTQSSTKIIRLKNTGTTAIGPLTASLSDSDFSFTLNGCSNKTLAPNGACDVRVSFNASAKTAQLYEANLIFGSLILPIQATVAGASTGGSTSGGSTPSIAILESTLLVTDPLNFGSFSGTQSITKILTVKNTGTSAVVVNPILGSTDFTFVINSCVNKNLTPNGTCSVRVNFSASGKSLGLKQTTLTVHSSKSLALEATVLSSGSKLLNLQLTGGIIGSSVLVNGQSYSSSGSITIPTGSLVTVTSSTTPSNSSFGGFSGACSGANSCSFVITGNATLSAGFSCQEGSSLIAGSCVANCSAGNHLNPISLSCESDSRSCSTPSGPGTQQWSNLGSSSARYVKIKFNNAYVGTGETPFGNGITPYVSTVVSSSVIVGPVLRELKMIIDGQMQSLSSYDMTIVSGNVNGSDLSPLKDNDYISGYVQFFGPVEIVVDLATTKSVSGLGILAYYTYAGGAFPELPNLGALDASSIPKDLTVWVSNNNINFDVIYNNQNIPNSLGSWPQDSFKDISFSGGWGECVVIPQPTLSLVSNFSYSQGSQNPASCKVKGPFGQDQLMADLIVSENAGLTESEISQVQEATCSVLEQSFNASYEFSAMDQCSISDFMILQEIGTQTNIPFPILMNNLYFDFSPYGVVSLEGPGDCDMWLSMGGPIFEFTGGGINLTDGRPVYLTEFNSKIYFGISSGKPDLYYLAVKNTVTELVSTDYLFFMDSSHPPIVFNNKLYLIGKNANGTDYKIFYLDTQGVINEETRIPARSVNVNGPIVVANQQYLLVNDADASRLYKIDLSNNLTTIYNSQETVGTGGPFVYGNFFNDSYYSFTYGEGGRWILLRTNLVNNTVQRVLNGASPLQVTRILGATNNNSLFWVYDLYTRNLYSLNTSGQVVSSLNLGSQGSLVHITQGADSNIIYFSFVHVDTSIYKIEGSTVSQILNSQPMLATFLSSGDNLIFASENTAEIYKTNSLGARQTIASNIIIRTPTLNNVYSNTGRYFTPSIYKGKIAVNTARITSPGVYITPYALSFIDTNTFEVSQPITLCSNSNGIFDSSVFFDSFMVFDNKLYLGTRDCSTGSEFELSVYSE